MVPVNNSNMNRFLGFIGSEIRRGLEFSQTSMNRIASESTLRKILIILGLEVDNYFNNFEQFEND